METVNHSGSLFIVATPIGNLKDFTQRAIETLSSVDWIAAEDTRHSKPLLQHFAINKPLISLHDHNEQERIEGVKQRLRQGENGALISDAGTPLINDPGYHLVKALRDEGFSVVPIPGPSAVITALCAAGMPTDRFSYEGFLPAKAAKRLQVLQTLTQEGRTMVFYESPHRLQATLEAMLEVFGAERQAVVAKELTKQFEQFVGSDLGEIVEYFKQNPDRVRGEFVIMLQGADEQPEREENADDVLILLLLKQSLPVKQIAEIVSEYGGRKKKAVYQRAQELKDMQMDNG
ncbi:16S rRNA (cytidine(1402)-2'-O)-methyltransferase [Thiomicrorhabdus heinhorstiae]|uniref:Ribosomal RNA small subunit methyltransferase I n=1 Tax=Thiomicrorhabdus heinhorstiae TaxID=2748010 RepID=A0ABS0BX83_9GAMM|nr:16S rRNA (cytidine(1402)-2'-O)-methyltransferase [Thiomicrorhabdus heinhorstiae]MBF6058395.1 16S rRNA (cytidine(1402)-2'-O)-methyltransferase [Thiomicrorhabdus heinhorstiae]